MKTLRHTYTGMYHIVNKETGKTNCGRDASDYFSSGTPYNYDWTSGYPRHCSQCGNPEDFQEISDRMLADYERLEAEKNSQLATARQLAGDKRQILISLVWPTLKESLLSTGFNVDEKGPKGGLDRGGTLEVSIEVGSHTFLFKIIPPLTTYGVVGIPPYQIKESKPDWSKG